jgi:hypothetical protein
LEMSRSCDVFLSLLQRLAVTAASNSIITRRARPILSPESGPCPGERMMPLALSESCGAKIDTLLAKIDTLFAKVDTLLAKTIDTLLMMRDLEGAVAMCHYPFAVFDQRFAAEVEQATDEILSARSA